MSNNTMIHSSIEPPKINVPQDNELLYASVQNLGLAKIERHILICTNQTAAKCCSKEASLKSWEYLKKRLKELKLDRPTNEHSSCIFRTQANCLRVCCFGPILVVYPDGVWYRKATPEVIERIIQEHLIGNQVLEEEYAFLIHPLPETLLPTTKNLIGIERELLTG